MSVPINQTIYLFLLNIAYLARLMTEPIGSGANAWPDDFADCFFFHDRNYIRRVSDTAQAIYPQGNENHDPFVFCLGMALGISPMACH